MTAPAPVSIFPNARRYAEVEAMLVPVNSFIISTSQFLNRLAQDCEQKILHVNRQLQRLEALVTLLEYKVHSVTDDEEGSRTSVDRYNDGGCAEEATMAKARSASTSRLAMMVSPPTRSSRDLEEQVSGMVGPPTKAAREPPPGFTPVPVLPPLPMPSSPAWPPPPPPLPLSGGLTLKSHPRLQGYYALAALRVPPEIVKARMAADGYNPDWLDTPFAMAPLNLPTATREVFAAV